MSLQIEFDVQAIQSRIKRNSTLNVFCSSSEIVRIWNIHIINNLNTTKCTPKVLGFEESKLKDYFEDFLSKTPCPVFNKQFNEMHKSISQEVPNYGGPSKLLNVLIRLIIDLKLLIPIKGVWSEARKYDFHYYCAYIFWPTVWKSIDTSLDQKRNSSGNYGRIKHHSEKFRTCEEFPCKGKKFGSLSAIKRHRMIIHDLEEVPSEWPSQFTYISDSESDSEEEKWISFRCQKCDELFLTRETFKNHLTFHEDIDSENTSCSESDDVITKSLPGASRQKLKKIMKVRQNLANGIIIQCELCSMIFATREERRHHLIKEHNFSLKVIGSEHFHNNHKSSENLISCEHSKCTCSKESDDDGLSVVREQLNELEDYDLTKVLQYLGEEKKEKSEEQKTRQKRKKQAKKAKKVNEIKESKENVIKDPIAKTPEGSSVEDDSSDSKSEGSEHVQDILDETDSKENIANLEDSKSFMLEQANEVIDVHNFEGAAGGNSEASTEVSKYIDSLELENRCLKVSQQFFETTKEENTSLKKEVTNLNIELRRLQELLSMEKLKNATVEQENFKMRQKLQNIQESTDESQKCKICMEGKLEIAFTPCGHLFTCTNCAPSCKNCPLCRKPAKHMKIYLP